MGARDRLRGTLDVLILTTLADGPRHGYEIARRFAGDSVEEVLRQLGTGTAWARQAAETILSHSPTSLKLTLAALRNAFGGHAIRR